VTEVQCGGINKAAAFSLGNFFTGLSWNRYRYGLVLSISAGRMQDGIPAAGKVQWMFTGCSDLCGRNMITELTESIYS
jgi:hypothetical protein